MREHVCDHTEQILDLYQLVHKVMNIYTEMITIEDDEGEHYDPFAGNRDSEPVKYFPSMEECHYILKTFREVRKYLRMVRGRYCSNNPCLAQEKRFSGSDP